MPSTRPNLPPLRTSRSHVALDEQSFQNLLSAAFTIQEHNDQVKRSQSGLSAVPARAKVEATIVCPHCGALKATEESDCPSCHLGKFRPGERLQRNWASMWLMSQQHDLFPDHPVGENPLVPKAIAPGHLAPHKTPDQHDKPTPVSPRANEREMPAPTRQSPSNPSPDHSLNSSLLDWPLVHDVAEPAIDPAETKADPAPEVDGSVESIRNLLRDRLALQEMNPDETLVDDATLDEANYDDHFSVRDRISHRANAESEYLPDNSADVTEPDVESEESEQELQTGEGNDTYSAGALEEKKSLWRSLADFRVKLRVQRANLYLGAAISVAALALLWPTANTPKESKLGPMDRALVALGLAEVPVPVAHVKGDPTINVWVDPHTALYYCPGEEQYGKTVDGRVSSQRDAQMDRFEPAAGSVCE